jgi:FdhE protein
MQRILDPAQIEAFAERSIPRLRFADPAVVFLKRAERLRGLSEHHAVGEYLALMASLCDAQHRELAKLDLTPPTSRPDSTSASVRVTRAGEHGLPVLQALGWPRDSRWRLVLGELCQRLSNDIPAPVREICDRLSSEDAASLEARADRVLGGNAKDLDMPAAPFVMAALQVYWVQLTTTLGLTVKQELEAAQARTSNAALAGVCPVCGTLPVASIVRADSAYQGYRYLHCALCASEWHLVRIKCSHCLATEGIRYHYVEGGSEAIRAESCETCRTYRKILYQEKDVAVEPVADDLGSLALDLLMSAEKYHRACGNPLLWQPPAG